MKYVLSIAGSDSSGGAGLQADLKTFTNHQTYGMTIATVLTAQNPQSILAIEEINPRFIQKQLDSIFSFHHPDATKIGAVWSKENVLTIAKTLKKYKVTNIVLDPVMISTSKSKLVSNNTIKSIIKYLFPLATIITPNYYEAEILSGIKINGTQDVVKTAQKISTFFSGYILIKGGHNEQNANDYFYSSKESFWLYAPKIAKVDSHGTGCTLSSAIAANIANGDEIITATTKAKAYVYNSIYHNIDGLLNHNKGFVNKLPLFYQLVNDNVKEWEEYVNHEFAAKISTGKLDYEKFVYYLKQDYLYLKEFNYAFDELYKKARTKEEKTFCQQKIDFILNNELEIHKFFIDKKKDFSSVKKSRVCSNYTNFLTKNNKEWDFLDLLVALSVCYIGYAFLGQNIKDEQKAGTKYAKWLEEYTNPEFWKSANKYISFINKYTSKIGDEKFQKLSKIFNKCCLLEIEFFNQATI